MRMGQYDKAEKAVHQALEHEAQNADITSMVMQAKLFNLLAKVARCRVSGTFIVILYVMDCRIIGKIISLYLAYCKHMYFSSLQLQ